MPDTTDPNTDPAEIVRRAIEQIAPDVDAAALAGDVDYRDEAALDSMDFLAVLEVVRTRTGVEVPERDYERILTIDGFARYLTDHP